MASFDNSNAFGRPPHDLIELRIKKLFHQRTVNYIMSELRGRSVKVHAKGLYSNTIKLPAWGTGQGGNLSPLIFNLMVSHINSSVTSFANNLSSSGLAQVYAYADDFSLLLIRPTRQMAINDLSTTTAYFKQECERIKLHINDNKTTFLVYGNDTAKLQHSLKVSDTEFVTETPTCRYLGVRINNKQTATDHLP